MGILLALLLGASSPCADGKCPLPTASVCQNGECGDKKCDKGCCNCKCSAKCCGSSCCGKKVSSAAKSVRKCVRSRCRLFGRRR